MLSTKAAIKILGVSRTNLLRLAKKNHISTQKKIINGRAFSFYLASDIAAIKKTRAQKKKEFSSQP